MADQTNHVGQTLGDYRLVRKLGGGGFGDVYLGEHIHTQDQAAVKVLHTRLTRSDELKEFINEARTFRLRHPHIILLLDFGIAANDVPYLVMEYATHGTLRDTHPKGTQVPLSTVLSYVTPLASALQYAHDQQLIHRDVKPENMLLNTHNTVLLSDFGIATVAHSSHSLNTQQGIGGTLPYMAPEQIQGRPRPASDQYALGIVVYEWLTGLRPFKGTAVEIAMQHSMMAPPPLREQVPMLSADVEEVVLTALAKEPKHRFVSIMAFATALEQASQEQKTVSPVMPPPPPTLQTISPPVVVKPIATELEQVIQTNLGPAQPETHPQETDNQSRSSLGNSQETKQVQQLEQVKKEKLHKTVRRGLVYASLINSTCVSIALSLLLHSWLVLGEGCLAGLILAGITAASAKNESVKKQPIWNVSVFLIFPLAWGYAGWQCGLFMSHTVHLEFLPLVLALVGFVAGLIGYTVTCADLIGGDYSK